MSISTAALAVAAFAATGAGTIVVENAQPPALPRSSICGPTGATGDVECVLTLVPPQPGQELAAPARVLIRTQWAPRRCAGVAQVVELAGPSTVRKQLPIIDQAGSPNCS